MVASPSTVAPEGLRETLAKIESKMASLDSMQYMVADLDNATREMADTKSMLDDIFKQYQVVRDRERAVRKREQQLELEYEKLQKRQYTEPAYHTAQLKQHVEWGELIGMLSLIAIFWTLAKYLPFLYYST